VLLFYCLWMLALWCCVLLFGVVCLLLFVVCCGVLRHVCPPPSRRSILAQRDKADEGRTQNGLLFVRLAYYGREVSDARRLAKAQSKIMRSSSYLRVVARGMVSKRPNNNKACCLLADAAVDASITLALRLVLLTITIRFNRFLFTYITV
jgi:hypothetical protein